jgi:competence protein ComEC
MLRSVYSRRVRRPVLVIAFCLALFAGVAVAHYVQLGDVRWLWCILPVTIVSLRRQSVYVLCCLIVLGFGAGWWRGSAMMRDLSPYRELTKQQVTFIARVTEDGVYGARYQLTFSVDRVHFVQPYNRDVPGSVMVAGFGAMSVYRGDIVKVSGKLYPARGNMVARVSFAELQVLTRGTSPIDELRRKFGAGLQSALPEPAASFGLGLLIGQRSTLPEDIAETLTIVGLTHIIAVSGYNLTILVEATKRLLGGRSKYQMTVTCIALIGTFLLITGNSPSIVRASIISMLSIMVWYFGRTIKPVVLLLTAATVTILANPAYVWGNVSWYLSFLAFYGVVVLGPLATRRLYGDRQPGLVAKILIESLCAEIMTLPYVLYIFGQMSHVSLVANVLVAAFVPLAMLLCAVAGLAGMLVPFIAGWFAWPARVVLTYMLDVAQLLSRIPGAFSTGIGFSFRQMLACYGIAGLLIAVEHYKNREKYGILTDKIVSS